MAGFKFNVNVKTELNSDIIKRRINRGVEKAQYFLDNQVIKDSNYYVPVDQHYLEKSALLHSKIGKGEVIWQTPYARRLYYNPQYNFSKDINPNAQGLWFEAAKAMRGQGRDWITMAKLVFKQNF